MRDFYIVGIGCLILGFLMGIIIVPERVEIIRVPMPQVTKITYEIGYATIKMTGAGVDIETADWRGLTTVETEEK